MYCMLHFCMCRSLQSKEWTGLWEERGNKHLWPFTVFRKQDVPLLGGTSWYYRLDLWTRYTLALLMEWNSSNEIIFPALCLLILPVIHDTAILESHLMSFELSQLSVTPFIDQKSIKFSAVALGICFPWLTDLGVHQRIPDCGHCPGITAMATFFTSSAAESPGLPTTLQKTENTRGE